MPIITIDKRNWIKGQSTTNYLSDGGYSPDSIIETGRDNDNVGLLTWGRARTEYSTNLADKVHASTIGYRGGSPYRYSIGSGGRLYETDVVNLTHTLKYTESVKTYDQYSSILSFKNQLYITSSSDVWQEGYSFSTNDYDWWTATLSKTALTASVPHILFEFGGYMYITNGNKLWSTDGTTGYDSGSNTLTLTDDWIIYNVLTKGSEIYLFAVFKSLNPQIQVPHKIFVWDGYSENWTREIILSTSYVYSAVHTINGMYFSAISGLYLFDGYSYALVPNVRTITYMVAKGKDLFYTDGQSIFRYDTLYKSTYRLGSITSLDPITHIFSDYIQTLTFFTQGASVSKFYNLSYSSTSTPSLYTNYYEFEKPVWLRKIEILFSGTTPASTSYNLYVRGELDAELQNIPITDVGIKKWEKKINHQVDKFRLQLYSGYAGNRTPTWIKIYWEPSERSLTR